MLIINHVKDLQKEKWGSQGNFKAFKWIKPEDSENLTRNTKHDKRTSSNVTF